ncbi:Glutathione S-transferase kappa 1 [Mortierella sp. NVP85]|nr:Glutathione S-transferase kappa 1 [Mortierella sp. NVP85]
MSSRASILFYYDIVSPYSYLGVKLLNRYRSQWKDVDIEYRPFFLGGVMNVRDIGQLAKVLGASNQPPATVPAKGSYMFQDLVRVSAAAGIPFRFPSQFPLLTIQPMRLLIVLQRHAADKYEQCIEKEEYWYNDKNITEKDVLAAALTPILGSAEKFEGYYEMTAQKEVKQQLIDNTDEAVAAGAFGAPTMIVKKAGSNKGHLIFGSDRFEMIAHMLGQPYPGVPTQAPQPKL